MINLRNITLRRGANILLQNVNWTIYHKQRIGIIGANGTGKSSLFAMLLNSLHADVGDLEIPSNIKLAYLAQETPAYEKSALDFVLDGDTRLRELEKKLNLAESKNDGHQIAVIHQQLSEIDAYTANSRAAQLLDGLGFSASDQQKSVKDFSGGWRVRLNLAKALMCPSDVLLLDEPTNHLDLDAVLWLQNFLSKYTGTLLLISHDRDFLDYVVDHIAHVHAQQIKVYVGNYSSFEKQRAENLLLQAAIFSKQQKKIAHLQSFVNRFRYKASKARQAQSRLKAIEKMELITVTQEETPFQFAFKDPGVCPNPLISLEDIDISYGEKSILSHVNLSITPNDRIAFLGPNGAGKTSLIKLLAGEILAKNGKREYGSGLKIGYFAQHQIDHLELEDTPLEHLQKIAPSVKELELRTYLGSFGFSGERVLQQVKIFSGGEKSRLALALLIWKKPNLLLLDEPTNHLDLDMRQALSLALQDYQGAMIIVSHDRFLVRSTVDRLVLIAEEKCQNFDGDLDDYQQWLLDYRRRNLSSENISLKVDSSKKSQRQEAAKLRELRRPLLQKIKKLEDELNLLQKKFGETEKVLADTSLYEDTRKEELQKYLLEQSILKKDLKICEEKWLSACEDLEECKSPLPDGRGSDSC